MKYPKNPERQRRFFGEALTGFSLIDGNLSKRSNHRGITRSLRYMARHYRRPIQLDKVVAASGMSRRGFTLAFKRHVGCTPASLIRQARIELAKRLLLEQDLSLNAIASNIGFRSENTFCIAFSRATGMSPKRFQRQVWLSTIRSFRKTKTDGSLYDRFYLSTK